MNLNKIQSIVARQSFVSHPKKAFSLIELLVIVSVLFLLLALALFKLQNAKYRATVSRVHTDFRVFNSALELYRADFQIYPNAAIGDLLLDYPLNVLTTPNPYLHTCPVDPFGIAHYDFSPEMKELGYNYIDAISTSKGMPKETYGFIWDEYPNKKYMIHSCGPNRRWDVTPYREYDPTNGTISNGDMCMFGPL